MTPQKNVNGNETLAQRVNDAVGKARVLDIHTHLFAPQFREQNLWGIDELLTYHYLIAEFFRFSDMGYEEFWAKTKPQQADLIWDALFVKNTPLSEATCGVVGALTAFGLDPAAKNLREARKFFAAQSVDTHIDQILELAGVTEVVMTNDPFDLAEVAVWKSGIPIDPRFKAVVRLDCLLNNWPIASRFLLDDGRDVQADLGGNTISSLQKFLNEWVARMEPVYMAVSLPDTFQYLEESVRARLIREVVLPVCREHNLPFALMIGVRRQVNPQLRMGGDGVGFAHMQPLERLCAENPDVRFMCTVLSRENQHELCVSARKFRNLMPFGCWWFVNNPSIISEITRERFEMLGTSMIPQHSDARVLEQLVYKWRHSRPLIAEALTTSYEALQRNGRVVTDAEIARDVEQLFSGNFKRWAAGAPGYAAKQADVVVAK